MPDHIFYDTWLNPADDTTHFRWKEIYEPHEWVEDVMDVFGLASFGPEHFERRTKEFRALIPACAMRSAKRTGIGEYLQKYKEAV